MSTSENEKRAHHGVLIYTGVTVFCVVFWLIYDRFSHGESSPFMTFLFAFPLVLGLIPAAVFYLFPKLRQPGKFALNIYNPGVAAVNVGSALRGVFEIAGTASDYQMYLSITGCIMILGGACAYILKN